MSVSALVAPQHRLRPAGLGLRPIQHADAAFLSELYAVGRAAELAVVPWSVQQKRDFLLQQFELQHAHYEAHYPGADRLLIEFHGQAVGRVYVYRSPGDLRLMDIALMPDWQRRGIGGSLLRELIEESEATGATITLHVEANNPALEWYLKLGFVHREDRGVYQFLARSPKACGND